MQRLRFRWFWLRLRLGDLWEQNYTVVIPAAVILAFIATAMTVLFPNANAASLRSSLVITASSSATFLGFIFVSLAILAGRATSTSERLLDLWRSHEAELFGLAASLFKKCTEAAYKKDIELDVDAEVLGRPDSVSRRRWNRMALLEVVTLRASMLARSGNFTGSGSAASDLESFGLKDYERYVDSAALKSSVSATDMWDMTRRAIRSLQNSEFMTIEWVDKAVTRIRRVLVHNEIYDALETIARRRRASGRLFWLCTSASILTIALAFSVGWGITDDTISCVEIRMAFKLAIGLWWIAAALVLAYVRQVLRE